MRKESFIGLITGFVLLITFFLTGIQSSMAYEKQIQSLSAFMAGKIATAGKRTIAVVDFTDLQGNVTELGRFLAEEFSVALAGASKGFEVIDRTHLKSIMAEHKLASKGIIDPQTARKLGKIAGVGALITGTITPFGDSIRLSVKVLDTETARMISASTGNIAKTDAIEELLARGIEMPARGSGRPRVISSARIASGKSVEAEGFIFRPVRCRWSGGKIICTVSIINNGEEERKLDICGTKDGRGSHLYDNLGNQYPMVVQIGSSRESPFSGCIGQRFIPQLPVNVQFIADKVSKEATSMTETIYIKGFEKLVAVRNIPITKKQNR